MEDKTGIKKINKTAVITLCYNALPYTIKFLESLYANTPKTDFDLFVVDNASTDGTDVYLEWFKKHNESPLYHIHSEESVTQDQLERAKRFVLDQFKISPTLPEGFIVPDGFKIRTVGEHKIHIISNKENKMFSGGMNSAFDYIRNNGLDKEYDNILQINNDVLVSIHWLKSMIWCLNHKPGIGLVGPVSNFAGGRQQINVANIDGANVNIDRLNAATLNYRNQLKDNYFQVGILTGLCLLFNKDFWNDVGNYPSTLTTFDDNWLSLKVLHCGWKLYVDLSTFIWHFGSQTFKSNKMDYDSIYNKSFQEFLKVWSETERNIDFKKEEEKWKNKLNE